MQNQDVLRAPSSSLTSTRRSAAAALAVALFASTGAATSSSPAAADTQPPAGTASTVAADALPTAQVNGVVWKTAVVGRTVYAVGSFTKARPAGTAVGSTAEVTRSHVLAFDLVTGELLPFAPVLDAQALTVKASPDGSRIYIGGDFRSVNGVVRNRLAAFDTATGALDTSFAPSASAQVRALAVTASTVYAGGVFGNAGGTGSASVTRKRLAAFSRSTGALLPWAPTADDDQVEALVASPDGSRVVVGGRFQSLNGSPRVGVGAVDGTSGATQTWQSTPIPARLDTKRSWVTDLTLHGTTVLGAANGDGYHWFDGRFAADLATGNLKWLDNCYGATYGIQGVGDVVYSVGHAHECDSLSAFPQTSPVTYHRALAETLAPVGTDPAPPSVNSTYKGQPVPGLLHWFPSLNQGSYTGQNQGPWSISAASGYLVMGGEFTRVNGVTQQGLVRFATSDVAADRQGPIYNSSLVPGAVSTGPGTVKVAWPATWDRDNASLRYQVFRDSETTPIHDVQQAPTGWRQSGPSTPYSRSMGFTDTGLAAGSSHTYKLRVTDAFGNRTEARSAAVTVRGTALGAYARSVLDGGADEYWRLGESARTASDSAAHDDLIKKSGVTTTTGVLQGDSDAAGLFNGTSSGYAVSKTPEPAPAALSVEAWVKTTSTSGGKIVGYGLADSGNSTKYDRHLYMDNTGKVLFGVYNGGAKAIASTTALNDGTWHHVVGTLDPTTGMTLYVDGRKVASNTVVTRSTSTWVGYWRVGGDTLTGWPNVPTSGYLNGAIDEVAVHPRALAATEVAARVTARSG